MSPPERSHPRRSLTPLLALVALLAAGLLPAGSALASTGPAVDPRLAQAIASAIGPFEVIVTFQGQGTLSAADEELLRQVGVARGVTFQALPMAGVLATSEQVLALAAQPSVRSLWLNEALQYENASATVATRVDEVRADRGMTKHNGGMPVAGHGVTVLVNDSGVDGLHPDLKPRLVQNATGYTNLQSVLSLSPVSYVEGVDNTDIGGGHGTHVAGTVAGTGAKSGGRYEGVAPGANVVAFSSGLGLSLLNTLGGFDYALRNRVRFNIRVITNSWGSTSDKGDFNPDHPVNIASRALNEQGVVVVFSAGNSGPGAGTISGNYKKAPWVITVAAGDTAGALASFSSRGVKDRTVTVTGRDGTTWVSEDRPTVTAPGVRIISTRASGSSLSPLSATGDAQSIPAENLVYYTTMSGTSMAAPHVAGIVALMLDANPALTPAQVKELLQATASPMPGYELWEVGAGYADAYDAVAAAFELGGPPPKKCNVRNPCKASRPRAAVAVIDTAINPYHDFFHAGGEPYALQPPSSVTPEVLEAFGIDEAHIIDLTRSGDFNADYLADKSRIWDGIHPGELYWIRGTNILAITFKPGTRPILPDSSSDTHGVGTAAAVLRANPEAIVVFVEGVTDASENFAFNHPQVDIVTTSYGPVGSIPLPYHLTSSYTGVVTNGKLHFGAADNSPSTSIQDGTAGPWWSIGIAGFEEHTSEGRQVLSGTFPDFIADFTQTLPYCFDCEAGMSSVSGTSFATPRSAGTMSKVLLEARRALGHIGGIRLINDVPVMAASSTRTLTNWRLRRALEEGAYYPSIHDYNAVDGLLEQSVPVLDLTPWTQAGWGAITPEVEHQVVQQTLAHLGLGGVVTRTKDPLACESMKAQIVARHAYWDEVVFGSESWMTLQDPYVYCGQ